MVAVPPVPGAVSRVGWTTAVPGRVHDVRRSGGLGLDLSNPVQRAWRDANAVGRHISMNWDAVGTMYGQLALGLTPQGQY